MLTLSGASNFVLLGRTAHTSHDEITNHLVQAFCLTTFLRADVSCFGDIANAVNAGRRRGAMHIRHDACCWITGLHLVRERMDRQGLRWWSLALYKQELGTVTRLVFCALYFPLNLQLGSRIVEIYAGIGRPFQTDSSKHACRYSTKAECCRALNYALRWTSLVFIRAILFGVVNCRFQWTCQLLRCQCNIGHSC